MPARPQNEDDDVNFLVDIDRIPTSGLVLDGELSFEELQPLLAEQWDRFEAPLALSFRIEVHGDGVFARGELRVRPTATCSRCAVDVNYDIHETFLAAYAPEGDDKKDLHFEGGVLFDVSKPPVWYPLPADEIDLSEAFGEALLFALPDYPRCADDCEVPEKWRATGELAAAAETEPREGDDDQDEDQDKDVDAPPSAETVDPRFQKLLEIRNAMAADTSGASAKTSDTTTSPTAKGAAGETSNDRKKG